MMSNGTVFGVVAAFYYFRLSLVDIMVQLRDLPENWIL